MASPRGSRLSVEIVRRKDGEVNFDAWLKLDRGARDERKLRRVLRPQPATTIAILARIYAHALRAADQGRPVVRPPARAHR